MNIQRKSLLAAFLTILSVVLVLWAGEDEATDKAMSMLLEHKDAGFVNVRGERRGFVQNEGELSSRIKLYGEQEYLAVIAGDKDVEKLQLIVKDKNGNVVSQSDGATNNAALVITPPKKDKYTFLFITPGKGGYYHFSLVTK
jgi:hypothetical protein